MFMRQSVWAFKTYRRLKVGSESFRRQKIGAKTSKAKCRLQNVDAKTSAQTGWYQEKYVYDNDEGDNL